MNRIGIMQITDTLAAGGLERVAVNLANGLSSDLYSSHLCMTRQTGPLERVLSGRVQQLHLNRRGRFDLAAIRKLAEYIHAHRIQILHAHGTSLFIAAACRLLHRNIRIIWHDHFGGFDTDKRHEGIYRTATKRVEGIISVTEPLAHWARQKLAMRRDRVWYIPNFAAFTDEANDAKCVLPGIRGFRVVCVANLRPQKDHVNLLRAFQLVVSKVPQAHLILVGIANDRDCLQKIQETIAQLKLANNVSWLGGRSDVQSILKNCDVGVLSSRSEGLPLALIEYGLANLPAISTKVGQCTEVLDHGKAGMLVPPCSPAALAQTLLALIQSPVRRNELATTFSRRIQEYYSAEAVMRKVCGIYETILDAKP